MKRTRVFLIMLAFVLIMSACAYYPRIPKSIKNSFTYRYDGKSTGIDTLINIDGYYREMRLYKRSPTARGFLKDTSIYYIDTSYYHFMFYDNGIFAYSISDYHYDVNKKKYVKKDVSLILTDVAEDSETLDAGHFYGNYWGGYIIYGDTIKVQQMFKGMSLNAGWHLSEKWYKIIDKNTLLCINYFNLPATEISQPAKRTQYPIIFFPITAKPKPDKSWILKEKWFWCSEDDWKVYMESLKRQ